MSNSVKDVVWFEVDTTGMSKALQAKYAALKEAQAKVTEIRKDFEDHFIAAAKNSERIDAEVQLAFGYKFGKLSVAKVDKAKPKASTKPKFTF